MSQKDKWRELLLKIILVVGGLTLTVFPILYAIQGMWFVAILEGFCGLILWISLVVVLNQHTYFWPAVISWLGVMLVLVVLLFTGGVSGTGLYWWTLMPIISFILFGSKNGLKAFIFGLFIFFLIVFLSYLRIFTIYFSMTEIIMSFVNIFVVAILMYNFENIAGKTREEAQEKADLLAIQMASKKETENQLTENLRELEMEKDKQQNVRTAMLNLLEDAKDMELQLIDEKANVEEKVNTRTHELTEANARLLSAINSVPRVFVVFDEKNNIVLHNDKMETILQENVSNWTLDKIDELLGKKVNIKTGIEEVLKNGNLVHIRDIDYRSHFLSLYIGPVLSVDSKTPIGTVLTIEDITEKMIMERSKDEFFSIASHELRTPLTAIRGNTSMILEYFADKLKDPELKSMVDDIHESSIRLINIVNDFLNVSRLEQKRMVYDMKEFNVEKIIPDTIKEYDATGSSKKINIDYVAPATPLPTVIGDAEKVRQVLINLLGNALKFTDKGSITVSTEIVKGFVKILVTDTGRGISSGQQNLLFHKFQQAGTSLFTRDTAGGSGLGLYISKMMIEGMGGEVKLERSEEGKGSTFSFSLPIINSKNV